jgi:hypothetical protein
MIGAGSPAAPRKSPVFDDPIRRHMNAANNGAAAALISDRPLSRSLRGPSHIPGARRNKAYSLTITCRGTV